MSRQEIIGDAFARAATLVSLKPEIGQRVYQSHAVVEDGLACKVAEKNWTMETDVPNSMGGENTAPSPSVLFRAAVASCVAIGIKMWASRDGVPIGRTDVRFDTKVDARGQFGVCDEVPAGIVRAELKIHLESNASHDSLERIVNKSLRYSAVLDCVVGRFPIDTKITFIDPNQQRKESSV